MNGAFRFFSLITKNSSIHRWALYIGSGRSIVFIAGLWFVGYFKQGGSFLFRVGWFFVTFLTSFSSSYQWQSNSNLAFSWFRVTDHHSLPIFDRFLSDNFAHPHLQSSFWFEEPYPSSAKNPSGIWCKILSFPSALFLTGNIYLLASSFTPRSEFALHNSIGLLNILRIFVFIAKCFFHSLCFYPRCIFMCLVNVFIAHW